MFLNEILKQCWKRRNCSLGVNYPFPTVFLKDLNCRHVKTRACMGKGEIYCFGKSRDKDYTLCPMIIPNDTVENYLLGSHALSLLVRLLFTFITSLLFCSFVRTLMIIVVIFD